MSRVFVADEVRLGRKVAIKVLSPELAQGLSAERFEREILLAASLQQANIVPVLATGEVEGLPYFTMPFIEGESLRTRLHGKGLPVDEVIAILRDVTKALAYAHAHGIVHRDIKPDNVLLSGGTAVVTDFGIAKALSASRAATTGATLTQLGTSIGTPAYMAPEQVAGDTNIDHRVDLYSLGCMAQELLTGQTPFSDRAPQRMLAAHLSETPPAIGSLRADVPASLTLLVQALLRKDPADRPASAAEVLKSLNAVTITSAPSLSLDAPGVLPKVLGLYLVATMMVVVVAKAAIVAIGLPSWAFTGALVIMLMGLPALLFTAWVKRAARAAVPMLTPGGSNAAIGRTNAMTGIALRASPHVSWRRTIRMGVLALGCFVLVVAAFMGLRGAGIGPWGSLIASGSFNSGARILLVDFTSAPNDSALAKVLVEAVRAAMSQSTSARLIEKVDVAQVLQQMQQLKDAALTNDNMSEVAARAGAEAILRGQLAPAGTGYAISLELLKASDGVQLASFQGSSEGSKDLLALVDDLARKLRSRLGESLKDVQQSVPLERATTTSLLALQKYSEATVANDIDGDYERAYNLLQEAVALDSNFALAWRKLAVTMSNRRIYGASVDSVLERAKANADRLPPRERYLILAHYYTDHSVDADRARALEAYQAAFRADSSHDTILNNLGVLFSQREQLDSADRYLRRQAKVRPSVRSWLSVATNLADQGRLDEATAILDSLARADSTAETSKNFVILKGSVLLLQGREDSALRVLEFGARSALPSLRWSTTNTLLLYYSIRGQLQRSLVYEPQVDSATKELTGTQPIAAQAITNDLMYLDRPEEARRGLDAIMADKSWNERPLDQRPYYSMAWGYALAGEPQQARRILARWEADDPIGFNATINQSGRESALGEIALAEGSYTEAIQHFRATNVAPDGFPRQCKLCADGGLARTFDRAGQPDSALVYYEKFLSTPAPTDFETSWTPLMLKRSGELYESRGELGKALGVYRKFVALWQDADPELQAVVKQVRQRIAELERRQG